MFRDENLKNITFLNMPIHGTFLFAGFLQEFITATV